MHEYAQVDKEVLFRCNVATGVSDALRRRRTPAARAVRARERDFPVTYVITEPCKGVKDASCVEVCPVDCIHSDDDQDMYFIDPEECIDCGACESVCPVNAIYYEEDTPEEWKEYIAINANYFKK